MDVQQRLDDIVAAVENARSMPMSASCVVNRAELLAQLAEVREALPGSLAQAREVLGDREQVVAEAQQEAQRIIAAAQSERGSLISGTEVARRSQEEADRILGDARREAAEIRAEADDYVDSKLANFEVVLSKTIGSVDRGREKLLGRAPGSGYDGGPGGAQDAEDDAPDRTTDPAELRERADAYVEKQFRAFEAVLSKTLEAVGRGRQKLTGHRPTDELGAHMAAQDEAANDGSQPRTSDAEYLAGLAAAPEPPRPQTPSADPYAVPSGHQGDAYPQDTYAAQGAQGAQGQPYAQDVYGQDAYGYQQASAQDPGSYPAPDPYGHPQNQQGAQGPQDAYGYPPQPYPGQDGYGSDGYGQGQGAPDPRGYAPDPYGAPQGQPQGYGGAPQLPPAPGYAPQDAYPAQDAYPPQGGYPPASGGAPQPGALDETSLFDTSMIDLDQLRQYEQGR
ncbi:cell division initiation protein [Streptomyces sp. 549]|uniref:cell division initiation protein n=1 Tax=Streptomyces sp. 549 TaxID=3049076 RepID=UPI0024C2D17C|nr:cell division initiation protein [Streptomyces sp. 549]MDK1475078.1 cell division initiation protein [Streptomyces sp. 549]